MAVIFDRPNVGLMGGCNAGGGTRTLKGLLPPDFESGASANSATPAKH
jgi:hypothetical protein